MRCAASSRTASSSAGGRSVALIFEKPSTRTRLSFEVGVVQLGGQPLVIDATTTQLGRGETVEDTARVLSRYVDAVVIRTYGQERIERLAAASDVPVVNALTDYAHPCQALADLLTILERASGLSGLTLGYLGDANNTAAKPDRGGHRRDGGGHGRPARRRHRGGCALHGRLASMGQEGEARERSSALRPYQLNEQAVAAAAADVIVLHGLPAHRDEEIAATVLDGAHAAVWDQAENRLHAQKALLAFLLPDGLG